MVIKKVWQQINSYTKHIDFVFTFTKSYKKNSTLDREILKFSVLDKLATSFKIWNTA